MLRPLSAALCAALLAGCAHTASTDASPPAAAARPAAGSAPFPGTYRPIAAPPVLIAGATVLTGDGRRLD
ncbi:MAG: hypothetical protein KIS72_09900, partial [Luteimonas sp.]|nr:hypothetical protein [Luteimonas sp.]